MPYHFNLIKIYFLKPFIYFSIFCIFKIFQLTIYSTRGNVTNFVYFIIFCEFLLKSEFYFNFLTIYFIILCKFYLLSNVWFILKVFLNLNSIFFYRLVILFFLLFILYIFFFFFGTNSSLVTCLDSSTTFGKFLK